MKLIKEKDEWIMVKFSKANPHLHEYKDTFFVKYINEQSVGLYVNQLIFPKEYAGKWVKLKVKIEEVKHGEEKQS